MTTPADNPTASDVPLAAGLVAVPLVELQQLVDQATKRFLSVKGAAEYSSLSEDSIRQMVNEGKLTAHRPRAGKVLIDRRQLDRVILSSTKEPKNGRGRYNREG